jgi:hypothetical protein
MKKLVAPFLFIALSSLIAVGCNSQIKKDEIQGPDQQAIYSVLEKRYQTFNARDYDGLRTCFSGPLLADTDRQLQEDKALWLEKNIKFVKWDIKSMTVTGDKAEAKVYEEVQAGDNISPRGWTFQLVKSGNGWTINDGEKTTYKARKAM